MAITSNKTSPKRTRPERDRDPAFKWRAALGLGLIALLVAGIGGWAGASSLSGAVIASGQVVVDSSIKKIQHPTGGIIAAINVKAGDRVTAGDLLVHLDDTQTRANLEIVRSELTELTGRKARLAAERDSAPEVTFPNGFPSSHASAAHVIAGERHLFEARAKSNAEQKAQLRERIGQFRDEIKGLRSQERSKADELALVREEHARVADMYKRQLLPVTRMLQMQREVARIGGEDGSLLAQIARTEGQINETELRIIELDTTRRAEAQKELRDIEARGAELAQREVAAADALTRVDIRAPQSGVVHDLAVHTIGGVIGPGETIMGIVPLEDQMVIEVRIAPTDIDQVSVGQATVLRFPAFNQRTTPELKGNVAILASDVSREPQTGVTYYTARINVEKAELARLDALKLVPGMPVEAFIQTGDRTPMSYLVKPFRDQLARAFREQ